MKVPCPGATQAVFDTACQTPALLRARWPRPCEQAAVWLVWGYGRAVTALSWRCRGLGAQGKAAISGPRIAGLAPRPCPAGVTRRCPVRPRAHSPAHQRGACLCRGAAPCPWISRVLAPMLQWVRPNCGDATQAGPWPIDSLNTGRSFHEVHTHCLGRCFSLWARLGCHGAGLEHAKHRRWQHQQHGHRADR